jgi:hypothetical protein
VTRSILLALAISVLTGCPAADDSGDDAFAPEGSRCTGFGASFRGGSFVDRSYWSGSPAWAGEYSGSDVPALATGGTQAIVVGGVPSSFSEEAPYTVGASGPALEIVDPAAVFYGQTRVRGAAPGTADLCVYDAEDRLVDGVPIAVRDARAMMVLPGLGYSTGQLDESIQGAYPPAAWKRFIGEDVLVAIGLVSGDGWRLVDDSTRIEVLVDDDARSTSPYGWDGVLVDAAFPTTATVRATLGSGEVFESELELVNEVDAIERAGSSPAEIDLDRVVIGGWASLCFRASHAGAVVLGAPWTFTVTPNATLTIENLGTQDNCTLLRGLAAGPGVLTASVGEVALSLPFNVLGE